MYPITYEADYNREPNRLTTFFRVILAIPWLIVGYIYAIVALVVLIIAWFALLILGRYPEWAYNFISGVVRFTIRLNAWVALQTDQFPPFGLGPDPTYPVRVQIAPRAERQSRLKTFFRGILAIPLIFVAYAMNPIHFGGALVSWLTIVFRGYQPAGAFNALTFTTAWQARSTGYLFLLRDEYPPVGAEGPQVGDVRGPGQPALGGATTATAPGTQAQTQAERPGETSSG